MKLSLNQLTRLDIDAMLMGVIFYGYVLRSLVLTCQSQHRPLSLIFLTRIISLVPFVPRSELLSMTMAPLLYDSFLSTISSAIIDFKRA